MPPAPKTQKRTTKAQTGEVKAADANELGEDLIAKLSAELQGKSVHAKIAWVQQHVGVVEKTGKVEFGRTRFEHMQEHGLINVLRPLWRIAGLCVIGGVPHPEGYRAENGMFIVDFELRVTNIEDSSQAVSAFYPNVGTDTADKGFNKAYTGAMKYALQKFFLVPTSDIDDNETLDVTTVQAAQAHAPAKPASVADHPSEQHVVELRTSLIDAGVPVETIVNELTARYGTAQLAKLTQAQFADFENRGLELIAAAQKS